MSSVYTKVALSSDELTLLRNALNEVCNGPEAIQDWEFSTRMGDSREKADELQRRLGKIFDEIMRDPYGLFS